MSVLREIVAQRTAVIGLCERFGVRRLDLFGSAVTGEFDPTCSDLDLLVEIEPPAGLSRFDAYFGFKEALEELLGLPVDLVDPSALRNPYFAATVEPTRQVLYAA